ncbi:MAG: hypothetical protein EXS17_04080 [Phycisphaerales bacterium]|nr:hypothetical protein [Phycisphaerales bacterium]
MSTLLGDIATVARRECAALFYTPTIWGALAIFAFATGVISGIAVIVPGAPAELRTVAAAAGWAMLLTAPALSLRPTTEERRSGFWEILATSPASVASLVMGRYLAGMIALVVLALVGLGGPFAVLEALARPDVAAALCAATGVLLAGSMYLASGIFFGSLVTSAAVAYMATFFSWLIVLIAIRSIAPLLASSQADLLFAADPIRRLEGFLDGSLDSSNVVYFVSVTGAFLIATTAVQASEAERVSSRGAVGVRLRVALGVVGAFALASAVAAIAHAPIARNAIDATKSRQWVLSAQTSHIIEQLPTGWQMTWIAPAGSLDSAITAQVDEVVQALAASREGFLTTIDPTSSGGVAHYATWLARLVEQRRGDPALIRESLADALAELAQLSTFATSASQALAVVAAQLPTESSDRAPIEQALGAVRALATGAPLLADSIAALRTERSDRALPCDGEAATILAQNHRDWALQFGSLSSWLASRALDERAPEALRDLARKVRPELSARARALLRSADALDALPVDVLSQLSKALAQGGAIVVESPAGIAVISDQEITVGSADEDQTVRFDRRFRVEQLASAAIRSIMDSKTPQVILVHAQEGSLLDATADGSDCAALCDALRAARIEVREWRVTADPKPIASNDAVWMIVPLRAISIEADARERALLEAVGGLVKSERAIFLSLGPSVRPLAGRSDPWAEIALTLGARATTDAVIVEDVPVAEGRTERRTRIELVASTGAHLLANALVGQRVGFGVAVPVALIAEPSAMVTGESVLVAQPHAGRSIERDWRRRTPDPKSALTMTSDVSVAVAATRRSLDSETVRAIVVGSPSWMLSATVDALRPGSGREVLLNPGNREFAVNSALWLAGLDHRIGDLGSGRETPRIANISVAQRLQITAGLALGVPMISLLMALLILLWRGRA